jgi:signal transduction histidine kinase
MRARKKAAIAAIVFTALALAAFNAGWWWYYRSIQTYLEYQLSQRLTGVAATAAVHISPEDVDALLIDNLDVYAAQLIYLDSLARIDSLSEASIIDLDFDYLVSTREDIPPEGYLLAQLNFDSLSAAIAGRPAPSALYDVDGTYLKSAYAPLFSSDGDVAAIFVAEAGAGYFSLLGRLQNNLFALAGGSAAVVLVFLIFYIIYNRHMTAAEEKLFQAGSQAALGRMVAVVSHEIKNPMMIIRAAGERIEKKYEDPEASFIVEEVSRLDNIVSGYLSFAGGGVSLNLAPVDPVAIGRKVIDEFRPQFEAQGIELKVDIDENLPHVSADRIGLRQVIINLLLNAMQAVSGEDYHPTQKLVSTTIRRAGDTIKICISDNGPGIKPSQREKLFEPFFTTKTQGSGLGLYLSRRIIEQHRGRIGVSSDDRGLTTFTVTLPIGEQE